MNIGKRPLGGIVGLAAATAFALLPAFAAAGDLTGTNSITGNLSSANGQSNSVPGDAAFASGQENYVEGRYNSAFGYLNGVYDDAHLVFGMRNLVGGWSNLVAGWENQTFASSQFNFVTGSFNDVFGDNAWVGGSYNLVNGNRSLLFGQYLDDNGEDGAVIFSDNNPFDVRDELSRFQPARANSLSGVFDGGYALRTNSGQGANPDAGVYILPTPANTAAASSPAFVGINNPAPTAALDVVGDAVVDGNNVAVGQENLRILRGQVTSTGGIGQGSGFISSRTVDPGQYTVTYDTPFSGGATPVATAIESASGDAQVMTIVSNNANSFQVVGWRADTNAPVNTAFHFIVIGPR